MRIFFGPTFYFIFKKDIKKKKKKKLELTTKKHKNYSEWIKVQDNNLMIFYLDIMINFICYLWWSGSYFDIWFTKCYFSVQHLFYLKKILKNKKPALTTKKHKNHSEWIKALNKNLMNFLCLTLWWILFVICDGLDLIWIYIYIYTYMIDWHKC